MLAKDLRFLGWIKGNFIIHGTIGSMSIIFVFLPRKIDERTCSWTPIRIFLGDILKDAEILCEQVRGDLPAKFSVSVNVTSFAPTGWLIRPGAFRLHFQMPKGSVWWEGKTRFQNQVDVDSNFASSCIFLTSLSISTVKHTIKSSSQSCWGDETT